MSNPEKAKQARLPGMVPKKIAEIQDAAEALREVRTERMELGEREEKAQSELVEIMKKHGVKRYAIDEEYEALVERKERAYVRKIKRKARAKDDSAGGGKAAAE
jgi:pimeloyl-CoA synthetase